MSPQNNHLQRPPAAVLYADELAKLKTKMITHLARPVGS
ncbi:ATPase [Escherichia coli]|uniref:ATPase n=1 Tax=Escherichia coli TaxID=562 RepID=A0A377D7S7_ECOLX|nr:ATPase [Escherichia coli]